MKYQVDFGAEARSNFFEAARWWAKNRSVEQARRWIEQFQAAIDGLAHSPQQHSLARESDQFSIPLRELHFGLGRRPTHRALFYIEGDMVHVVSVRHVGQRDLTPDDM
jgi:plasmid stabilization system protein ParE